MEDNYSDILKKMKLKGYKLTPQRKTIIDAIFNNNCDSLHLSAEEIYDIVKINFPDIGLATVYRTLIVLDELKIISKINFDDGCDRYEMIAEKHQHHHLICKKCGKVIEVSEDLLEKLEKTVEKNYEFKIIDHNVKIYGLCKKCSND